MTEEEKKAGELIRSVLIGLKSGRVFTCGLERSNIKKFRELATIGKSFINLSTFLPDKVRDENVEVWIRMSEVETIRTEVTSNIVAPTNEQVVGLGINPGA